MASRNPVAHHKTNKKWAENNPDKIRDMNYRRLYGITLDDYNKILLEQNGMCAVCTATDSGPSRKDPTKREPLFVDHCHETKKVRGLLCREHNTSLGFIEKNLTAAEKLIIYLRKQDETRTNNN